MNKIKLLSILVIVLVLINLTLIAFFVLHKPPHPAHHGPRDLVIEKLNFKPDQIEAYDELIQQHRTEIRTSEQEIRMTKNLLYAGLMNDAKTSGKDSLIQILGRLQMNIETIHYKHFENIKQLCTKDQLPAFEQLSKELASFFSPPPRPKGKRHED